MSEQQEATAQHTPGPWIRLGDGFGIFAGGECIASVYPVEDEKKAEREANAKLVAAAPKMLDVLKAIRDHSPKEKEVAIDEFSYDRLVENYRDAARQGIEAAS